ncbi:dihydroxyacetone kinase phosphoryl donor subunit DhaM [Lentibacillus saliphilus]|uniref:dihydroxyacetone kinase phosphoryl donor subunit DhaM n=1 Tax=Lentibacillus saliphilus TaxID=2737028 RepID=UPI001C30FCE6|nr:dihydroxyacetone kinase phosphoryl donor subunit DhaM [Lentibacillus saliphilus]
MTQAHFGVVIVSHVPELAKGLVALLKESAKDVPITYSGGTDDGDIGSSFTNISQAIEENTADEIFAFYDLGSAKMTLEMVMEMTDKQIHLMDTALVEGAFTAAALLQGGAPLERIMQQLKPLTVK